MPDPTSLCYNSGMSADGFTELDQFSIDENSVRLLSYKFCVQNYVVILGVVDPRLIEELERILMEP